MIVTTANEAKALAPLVTTPPIVRLRSAGLHGVRVAVGDSSFMQRASRETSLPCGRQARSISLRHATTICAFKHVFTVEIAEIGEWDGRIGVTRRCGAARRAQVPPLRSAEQIEAMSAA